MKRFLTLLIMTVSVLLPTAVFAEIVVLKGEESVKWVYENVNDTWKKDKRDDPNKTYIIIDANKIGGNPYFDVIDAEVITYWKEMMGDEKLKRYTRLNLTGPGAFVEIVNLSTNEVAMSAELFLQEGESDVEVLALFLGEQKKGVIRSLKGHSITHNYFAGYLVRFERNKFELERDKTFENAGTSVAEVADSIEGSLKSKGYQED